MLATIDVMYSVRLDLALLISLEAIGLESPTSIDTVAWCCVVQGKEGQGHNSALHFILTFRSQRSMECNALFS